MCAMAEDVIKTASNCVEPVKCSTFEFLMAGEYSSVEDIDVRAGTRTIHVVRATLCSMGDTGKIPRCVGLDISTRELRSWRWKGKGLVSLYIVDLQVLVSI
jgi:hypothetical protein